MSETGNTELMSEPSSPLSYPSSSIGIAAVTAAAVPNSHSGGSSTGSQGARNNQHSQGSSGGLNSQRLAKSLPRRNDLGDGLFPTSERDVPSAPTGLSGTALSDDNPLANSVIWGTQVNVHDVWDQFKDFLENYLDDRTGEPFYFEILNRVVENDTYEINIDTDHLRKHEASRNLYQLLIKYPQEIVPIMDFVAHDLLKTRFPNAVVEKRIQVRPYNLDKSINLRDLNPYDVDKLVSIKGLVTRVSSVVPDIKEGFFKCSMCDQTMIIGIERGRIIEPDRCNRCHSKHSLLLIHNRCKFANKQLVRIQETPDSVPAGQTPHSVVLIAFDSLVDLPRPGDRVEITGIYRAQPARVFSSRRAIRSIYKTYIDVVHYKFSDKKRVKLNKTDVGENEYQVNSTAINDESAAEIEEREQQILQLSQEKNIEEILIKSFAPSIFEMDTVKKGILCQLFGGSSKSYTKAASGRFRGELNILLCGDPGTSKSQMLQYVHKIAPRGIYTSGKGSSAVGLTAYIAKDPETDQHVLESGALVLSDGGICCIDEFDKMSDSTRSILHEVMEQQTVSVAKAGIICTLNARTSILASANPVHSRYERTLSVVENIDLPPTLLSRFDLIFIILDIPRESNDRKLAAHLTSLYQQRPPKPSKGAINIELLSAYISYAREKIHPKLTDAASNELVASYVEMRKAGQGTRTITATPRQLESMIRLSEALAKMRLSQVVEKRDIDEAVRLIKEAQQSAATDPITGLIDLDLITIGTSSASRKMQAELTKTVQKYFEAHPAQNYNFATLLRALNEEANTTIRSKQLFDSLTELHNEGILELSTGVENPHCVITLNA